ncbi:MAG: BtrH N-terminal domain-containing protein [Deltaproteobacteria bacterium]|nr:BtrH N-terminal domain-containing protein [Deltaproteobacteria bacterium]
MKAMIENYKNIPGKHCGTTAMKNLLFHYCGLELSEDAVFGLGSGIEFLHIRGENIDPAVVAVGRSITMEADAASALGIDYTETIEQDNDRAWEVVRAEIMENRPVMLTGDIFFLDYRNYKVRFPAHRFVLVGFDDDKKIAYIADRVDPAPQPCSYSALRESRNPDSGITTLNLWGKFHGTTMKNTMVEAIKTAVQTTSERMTGRDNISEELFKTAAGPGTVISTGLEGIKTFGSDIRLFYERPDVARLAVYISNCLEKFGTGGGNFRKMYAEFLRWADAVAPGLIRPDAVSLAEKSADLWTRVAAMLEKASKAPEKKEAWADIGDAVEKIFETEAELFE